MEERGYISALILDLGDFIKFLYISLDRELFLNLMLSTNDPQHPRFKDHLETRVPRSYDDTGLATSSRKTRGKRNRPRPA